MTHNEAVKMLKSIVRCEDWHSPALAKYIDALQELPEGEAFFWYYTMPTIGPEGKEDGTTWHGDHYETVAREMSEAMGGTEPIPLYREPPDASQRGLPAATGDEWAVWWRFNRFLLNGMHVVDESLCLKAVRQFSAPAPLVLTEGELKTMVDAWDHELSYASLLRAFKECLTAAGIQVVQAERREA